MSAIHLINRGSMYAKSFTTCTNLIFDIWWMIFLKSPDRVEKTQEEIESVCEIETQGHLQPWQWTVFWPYLNIEVLSNKTKLCRERKVKINAHVSHGITVFVEQHTHYVWKYDLR